MRQSVAARRPILRRVRRQAGTNAAAASACRYKARSGSNEDSICPSPKKPKMPTHQLEPGTLLARPLPDSPARRRRRHGLGLSGARQEARRPLCAVKEMIEMFADQNQRAKAVEDFKREAEVLAQLEHPSIPTIFDYFIEGGRYYLVMKWIGGGDLAEQMRMRGGIVDEADASRSGRFRSATCSTTSTRRSRRSSTATSSPRTS